jgi:uncharacterized integral membrane protein
VPDAQPEQAAAAPRRWGGVVATLVLALLLLVFILQNGRHARLRFLWLRFSLPVGVALLLAAVGGGLLVELLRFARAFRRRFRGRQRPG